MYKNVIVFSSTRSWINPQSNEDTRLEASALTIISQRWSNWNDWNQAIIKLKFIYLIDIYDDSLYGCN